MRTLKAGLVWRRARLRAAAPLSAATTATDPARNQLFRQNDDGTFVDATEESGLGDDGYGMGTALGDIGNDHHRRGAADRRLGFKPPIRRSRCKKTLQRKCLDTAKRLTYSPATDTFDPVSKPIQYARFAGLACQIPEPKAGDWVCSLRPDPSGGTSHMKGIRFGALAALAILCASALAQGKATIAVGEIEYKAMDSSEDKQYRAYGQDPRENTRAFVDMLTTALVKTNKFDVMERDRMNAILEEQGLTLMGVSSGGFDGNSLSLQGVDYILIGAITQYGQESSATKFGGFGQASEKAVMSVDVRVINIAKGQIGFADTVTAEASGGGGFTVGNVGTAGGSDESVLLGDVMRKTAKGVTNLIVTNIFPIKIVRVQENGEVMLNYGNSLLAAGNVLDVFSQGEAFVDPDTGEELGREEEFVAKLEVISAQPRFSKARIIQGDGIADGMLARVTNEIVDKKGETKEKRKRRLF